jgi:hypothetical protein
VFLRLHLKNLFKSCGTSWWESHCQNKNHKKA